MKKYVIVAGVNGAGKSTLYQTYANLKELPRVNVDEQLRGSSFNQKTTLCGRTIIKNIREARNGDDTL